MDNAAIAVSVRLSESTRNWWHVCRQCDPRAPVFFLSYSHPREFARQTGPPRGLDIFRFFDDLSENVAELVGRQAGGGGDPGYIDVSTPGGTTWKPTLLNKLGYCHSLVALLSRSYLESKWCAMEWFAFSQRKVEPRDKNGHANYKAIFPVFWAPVESKLPAAIDEVEWFLPGERHTGLYLENGIYGLLRVDEEAYKFTVWRLSQQIARSYDSYHVVPLDLDPSGFQDPFRR
jgi:hypothetical protein